MISHQRSQNPERVYKKINIRKTTKTLWHKLPAIARALIANANYPQHKRNERFFKIPNDPREHETKWHQWGIITHSRRFEQAYLKEVPCYLKQWGIISLVNRKMGEQIDGITKNDLLRISIPLHDLGKFAVRRLVLRRDKTITVSFKDHEKMSGTIIRDKAFTKMLKSKFGLTQPQIDYIATCAVHHYDLAIIRDEARKRGNYSLSYTHSNTLKKACRQVMKKNPDHELEVCLLWLADSLAKIETRVKAKTDNELQRKTERVKQRLSKLGLPERLTNAAMQLPINVAVAERYLKLWAKMIYSQRSETNILRKHRKQLLKKIKTGG